MPISDGDKLLNLGCGQDSHPAFVNVDLIAHPGVIGHDLRHGIPFPDATFHLVYHSTMLSHLRPAEALALTRECLRVLKPNGILRIVTEDLERMCRVYLEKLEAACSGDPQGAHDHAWMLLELYDQPTREKAGGGMADYVMQAHLPNEEFLYSRVGEQGRMMVAGARKRLEAGATTAAPRRRGLAERLRSRIKETVLTTLAGKGAVEALELGQFRLGSGQVSYKMYDRFSLQQLMRDAGFARTSVRGPFESGYTGWADVNLDVTASKTAARPHALIMEAVKA